MSIEDQIRADLAALSASGDPAALDKWFATNGYTPEQMAAASGYNLDDVIKAQNRAINDYSSYFQNELLRKQATTIDPSTAEGQQRLADIKSGFDIVKDDPAALQRAMYNTGIGAGDVALATGLDQGALANWAQMALMPTEIGFQDYYNRFTAPRDPNDPTVYGPGTSVRPNVGNYTPTPYQNYNPANPGDLQFDDQGNRVNPVQQLTGVAGPGAQIAASTNFTPTTATVGASGAGMGNIGNANYNSELIRSLRMSSAGQQPFSNPGVNMLANQSFNAGPGGMQMPAAPSGGLAFNPQPTTIAEYDPSGIFRDIYGRDPNEAELQDALGKKPADLRTELERSLAMSMSGQDQSQPQAPKNPLDWENVWQA